MRTQTYFSDSKRQWNVRIWLEQKWNCSRLACFSQSFPVLPALQCHEAAADRLCFPLESQESPARFKLLLLAAFGISFCLLHLRLALSAPEGKSLGLAFLGEWYTEQSCYYSLGQPRYQHGASSHPTTFLGDLMALQGVTAEWGLMWLTLIICGDMPCLVNKGSEKATSCFKSLKSLLPTEPRQGCGFLCFFCMLFFVLSWKSEESFLPMEFTPHSTFTTPCQNV